MIEAKIAYLNNPYELTFSAESLDENGLESTAVLCETLVTAISPGTEIAAYTGMPALRPGKIYPRLQGYCNVARVLYCGAQVTRFKPGDRVLTFASHRSHFVMPEAEVLCTVPELVSSEYASCAYLYHLGYDAVLKSQVRYGSRVVVLGLGVLGLGAVAMAAHAGASVYAVSDQAKPADIAKQLGARGCYCRSESEALTQVLGTGLADVVIATTNSWADWNLALQIAGQRSFIAVLGFPGRGDEPSVNNPLDSQHFYSKQLTLQAVGLAPEDNDSRHFLKFNEKTNLSFLINEISDGRLDPSLLISGSWPWHKITDAYKALVSRQDSPITYNLIWNN